MQIVEGNITLYWLNSFYNITFNSQTHLKDKHKTKECLKSGMWNI